MAWSEAPASAKAAGNSYPLSPTATAPVADSTPLLLEGQVGDRRREQGLSGVVER